MFFPSGSAWLIQTVRQDKQHLSKGHKGCIDGWVNRRMNRSMERESEENEGNIVPQRDISDTVSG